MDRIYNGIRRVDDLGRIVIPKELRRQLDIDSGDNVEFVVDGRALVIKRHYDSCVFCDSISREGSKWVDGVLICKECLQKIKNIRD